MDAYEKVIYIVVGGLILLCFLALTRVGYNVFMHPLSKVPGPRLYATSQFPYLYHLARGDWVRTLKALHDQYGPVVRFTPGDVSFISPDAWKKIYGHKTNGERSFLKDKRMYRPSRAGFNSIIVSGEEDHRRMRRLMAHAFSEKALHGQEDIMKHYIDLFITKLNQKAEKGEVVDIVKWFNFTTFDLIGDLAFGSPFGCLESGGYHPWVAMIFDGIKSTSVGQVIRRERVLSPLGWFLIPKKLKEHADEHWKLAMNTAMARVESGNTEREDFMSYILRHNDEKGMSRGEIVENANLLIIAGSETTATQLSGTTFYLLTNRNAYDKVVHEIRSSFSSEDDINIQSVNKLDYMLAVLNEGFRMYPPVPIGLPRFTPPGGEFIDGYWMPENTIVSVSQWSAYHSARNFKDPDKFIPERWLGDPAFSGDVKEVLQPFSTGPRNCIGKNLAYAEMRLILARLLWNFDLELMPDSRNWNQQNVYTLWEKGNINVKLTLVARGKEASILQT